MSQFPSPPGFLGGGRGGRKRKETTPSSWLYDHQRGCLEFRPSFGGKLSRRTTAAARLADNSARVRAEPVRSRFRGKRHSHPLTEIPYSIWIESTKPCTHSRNASYFSGTGVTETTARS